MTIPLFCFPYGGAGAGVYRPWKSRASAVFRVESVQYAGREERFAEPFYRTVAEAAEDCADRVEKSVGSGKSFAFFGHSLGALIAYETVRLLMSRGRRPPEHLIVSGSPGPRLARRDTRVGAVTDVDLMQLVRASADGRFDEDDIKEIMLPILRADVHLYQNYSSASDEPLPIPITVFMGAEDPLTDAGSAQQWSEMTTASHRYVELPGGHMYLSDDWERLWQTIEAALETNEAS